MFDIEKATQVAAYLLWKKGGRMSSRKLMRMMYLAEKQFILEYGERLTGDKMVSMPSGPVLSSVYDCFLGGSPYWNEWICNPGKYELAINDSIDVKADDPLEALNELSKADQGILDSVFECLEKKTRWEIVELTHDPEFCPELEDPHGSSYPIRCKDLLIKNGKTEEEANAILQRIEEVDSLYTATQRLV